MRKQLMAIASLVLVAANMISCQQKYELKKTQWQLVDVKEPGFYKGDVLINFITDTTLLSRYTEVNRTQVEPYALRGDTLFMGMKLTDTLIISSLTADSLILFGKDISFHFAAIKNKQ
jgi:hypothetical protein